MSACKAIIVLVFIIKNSFNNFYVCVISCCRLHNNIYWKDIGGREWKIQKNVLWPICWRKDGLLVGLAVYFKFQGKAEKLLQENNLREYLWKSLRFFFLTAVLHFSQAFLFGFKPNSWIPCPANPTEIRLKRCAHLCFLKDGCLSG